MCELCSECGRNRSWVETHCIWCGEDLVCSGCDATLSELQLEIDTLQAENAELSKCLKCGKHECNHRTLVGAELSGILALRVVIRDLKSENARLKEMIQAHKNIPVIVRGE